VTVAMVRLMVNLVQWPALMEYQKGDMVIPVETYQAMDATITFMAILCYFAPTNLTWKKKALINKLLNQETGQQRNKTKNTLS
jgi:hypothetical protein